MFQIVNVACLIGILIVETKGGPASFIKPCKANDNQCLLSSAQAALPFLVKGIPELGVPAADPIFIDLIRADNDNLKLGFRNMTTIGAESCKFTSMLRDSENNSIKFDLECILSGHGQYDISGKVVSVEAHGDGDYEIKNVNLRFHVDAKIENIVKNEKKYWKINGFDFKYNIIGTPHFNLKIPHDGDESKAKVIEEILDKKEVIEQSGVAIYKKVLSTYLDIVNKLFLAVPSNELELE